MKIAWSWLREFLETQTDAAGVAAALTMAGLACDGIAGEGGDAVLELAATTNRADWLSHYGVAREAAAAGAGRLAPPAAPQFAEAAPEAAAALRVAIDAPEACGMYCARVFTEVRVGPSRPEAAARLATLGHHGVNNIADWTNYTLLEMGQPTHAFDLDKLRGGELRARYARRGEKLTTLDGVERELDGEDLVIADAERPVALAGVMGGLESAITAATTRVALESAWFQPAAVGRTARRHGLRTEAAMRFERGADPAGARRAAELIAGRVRREGAVVLAGVVEAAGRLPAARAVPLRARTLERLLGRALPPGEIAALLGRLGIEAAEAAGTWRIPSWRPDLTQEADLVEEVARLYGYDKFEPTLPAFSGWARARPQQAMRDRARRQLCDHGYAEAMSLSFAAESECRAFAPASAPVRVLNPLSEEAAILRTSALPGLLHLLRNNRNRGRESPRLFELGKLYRVEAGRPRERAVLALGACGLAHAPLWSAPGGARAVDFYDLKGELETLFDGFELPAREYRRGGGAGLDGIRSAEVWAGATRLGALGQLERATAELWKLPEATLVAEIEMEPLYAAGGRQVAFRPPSRYPGSERDFSFLFAEDVNWGQIEAALSRPAIAHLVELTPVEIFRDAAKLGAGRYSLLLRARFQSEARTLRDDEVQAGAEAIVARLAGLGGQRR